MTRDRLAAATDHLRDTAVPPGPDAESIRAAERVAAVTVRRRPWVRRLGWAAGFLIAAGGAAYLLVQRSATLVFADVVRTVRQTHTVEATITSGPVNMRVWIRGSQLRGEANAAGQNAVQVVDLSSGTQLTLDVGKRTAQIVHGPPSAFDVYGFFAGLNGAGDGKPFGDRTIGGRRARGFNVTGKVPGAPNFPLTVWVDPATRLPVEIDANLGPMNAVARNIQFDQPLDDRLFSLTVPDGYRLAESRTSRYAGRVTDGQGKPLAGVEVTLAVMDSYIHSVAGGPSGDPVRTDADGRFSISGQDPPEAPTDEPHAPDVRLEFRRSDLLFARLEDASLLSPEQRADLRVRLRHGATLSGRVVDPAGRPVGGVRVKAIYGLARDDPETRNEYLKSAVTDAAGHFELRGLAPGKAAIGAAAADPAGVILCGQAKVDLGQPVKPVEITVRSLELPPGTAVHELLGLRLTDVTPAVKSALLLGDVRTPGVLVLSPGPNAGRIFNLNDPPRAGSVIWMANDVRLGGYRDLVRQLSAATAGQRAAGVPFGGSQVVYSQTRDDGREYSMTTYASLTAADMAEVARAAAAEGK